jgi:alkanesulfonate monooxygenase SsuD/methylene tetrahydromethanopterin reductase-like flavin-dependent oxidoreductase (luciferase family)
MRKVFERKDPVAHEGREISLPYTGPGATGVGKPLVSILHMNPGLPIWLGTGTEANVKLTAEIADGWLPLGFVPRLMPMLRPWLEEGFRRAGGGKGFGDFEIQARAEVAITDDVKGTLARMKPAVALYAGGMGHRDKNFHKEMMIRRGFGDAAQRSRSSFSPGGRTKPSRPCPTSSVTRWRWWGRSGAFASGIAPGPIPESPG